MVRVFPETRLLICGQAPGRRVHESGLPFTDPSGDRLRDWLGVDYETFYADRRIGVAAQAFCYPGTAPKGGDYPPPRRCAELWRPRLLAGLPDVELTLLVGGYAQAWALGDRAKGNMTDTVRAWREYAPDVLPLPHPSWRNTAWLKRNPWFEDEVLPLPAGAGSGHSLQRPSPLGGEGGPEGRMRGLAALRALIDTVRSPPAPSSGRLRRPPSPPRGEGRSVAVALCLLLAACATPAIQPLQTPPADFAGPSLQADRLVMDDGARLPLARWIPDAGEPWAVIVALHGMNDSRASFRLAGPWWAEHGIETWAVDQRGFGEAPGRGVWAGEARMTQDLRVAVALARARHPRALIAVAGESMGGAVAVAAFGSDRPPDADRVVLLAPAVWGWTAQGPVNSAGLWIAARAMGDRAMEAPEWAVRDHHASDNMVELIRNGRDPNSILSTRFDALYGLVDLMETASRRLGDVRAPTLLLYGANDNVIQKPAMRLALERAGDPPSLRTAWYPDGWHILNRDLQAETVYRDIEAWLRDASAPLPSGAGPVGAALAGRGGSGESLASNAEPAAAPGRLTRNPLTEPN